MKGRFVLLALLWVHSILYARQAYVLPQVTPRFPNAASMERYGAIPVSLSTGIPNIEIPSMMELDWGLNFGDMITYNQRGIDDFD